MTALNANEEIQSRARRSKKLDQRLEKIQESEYYPYIINTILLARRAGSPLITTSSQKGAVSGATIACNNSSPFAPSIVVSASAVGGIDCFDCCYGAGLASDGLKRAGSRDAGVEGIDTRLAQIERISPKVSRLSEVFRAEFGSAGLTSCRM